MKYKVSTPLDLKFNKPFPFYIEKRLAHKLNLLVKQLEKRDVWLLVTGDEGSGKTNGAAYLLYYFHCATGRPFTVNNFFFDSEALFNFAKVTKNQLLNWDEAALGGLSTEWATKAQINLIKLSITGRKLHHVFILCIPRFDKLKEDLRLDRLHGHIHFDLGKRNNNYGKYLYLTRRGIRKLNDLWKRTKKRCYNLARACGGHWGYIPYVFDKVFTPDDWIKYEAAKDKAIASIGTKPVNTEKAKARTEIRAFKKKMGLLKTPIKNKEQLASMLGIATNTLREWSFINENSIEEPENLDKPLENPKITPSP